MGPVRRLGYGHAETEVRAKRCKKQPTCLDMRQVLHEGGGGGGEQVVQGDRLAGLGQDNESLQNVSFRDSSRSLQI
jgi:hypothetical protein